MYAVAVQSKKRRCCDTQEIGQQSDERKKKKKHGGNKPEYDALGCFVAARQLSHRGGGGDAEAGSGGDRLALQHLSLLFWLLLEEASAAEVARWDQRFGREESRRGSRKCAVAYDQNIGDSGEYWAVSMARCSQW